MHQVAVDQGTVRAFDAPLRTYTGPQRRASSNNGTARCTYAECTIRNNTRICRAGSAIHEALLALNWETLSIDGGTALIKAPQP